MFDKVTIVYRGAGYEIGQGRGFYGVWAAGAPRHEPLQRWAETPEGWSAAWTRFASMEAPGTIVPVGRHSPPVGAGTPEPGENPVGPGQYAAPYGTGAGSAPGGKAGAIVAAGLLGVGVALGVAGLFPGYLGSASLASRADQVIPHATYLGFWAIGALLILLGGARPRIGALLSLGLSAITFGLFFSDAGLAIGGTGASGGAGLILSLLGWFACAAGSVLAFLVCPARPAAPGRPAGLPGPPVRGRARPRRDADPGGPRGSRRVRPGVGQLHAAHGGRANAVADRGRRLLRIQPGPGDHRGRPGDDRARRDGRRGRVLAPGPARRRPARRGHHPDGGPGHLGPRAGRARLARPVRDLERAGLAARAHDQLRCHAAFWIYCGFLVVVLVSCAWMLFTPQQALASGPVPAAGGYGPVEAQDEDLAGEPEDEDDKDGLDDSGQAAPAHTAPSPAASSHAGDSSAG